MLFRVLPDHVPPPDEDIDTPEMVDAAAAVERGERHLRVLAELTEIALKLARSLGELADVRIEAAKSEGGALKPGEDPTAAFNKLAQTIRRTLALEAKLAEDVKSGRAGLTKARTQRATKCKSAHEAAITEEIRGGLEDAYYAAYPEANTDADIEGEDDFETLFDVAFEGLDDVDEFRGYLDRPIGETVARLCAEVGLDPDSCLFDGKVWKVRRPPYEYDMAREELWRRWTGRKSPDQIPRRC